MKILFLNDDHFPRGPVRTAGPGGQSSPANIIRQLQKGFEVQGHEVHILTSHRKEDHSEIIREGNVTSLPISYRLSLKQWHCLGSKSISKMIDTEIAQIQPDVVHAHNIHIYLTYDALRIARKYTENVFITMHDVMSFAFWRLNTQRYLNSKGTDTRLSIFDHWNVAGLQYNPFRNRKIRSILQKNTKGIIAVSDALKNALEGHKIGPVQTIHNGVDLSEWNCDETALESFRSKFNLNGRKVILFGGRISPDKGTTPLLQALNHIRKEMPEVLLLVIAEEKRWKGCMNDELSDHVCCTGWLDRDAVRTAFFAADVITTPSLCLDCFPQTNLEAMAAGKPVVSTIFGGSSEVVENGTTGIILDPRNTDAFQEALLQLLEDSQLAETMGAAGRRRLEEHFSLKKQVEEYLQLFS